MTIIEKGGLALKTKRKIVLEKNIDSTDPIGTVEVPIKDGLHICKQNKDCTWYTILAINYDNHTVKGVIYDNDIFGMLTTDEGCLLDKLYKVGIELVEVANYEY